MRGKLVVILCVAPLPLIAPLTARATSSPASPVSATPRPEAVGPTGTNGTTGPGPAAGGETEATNEDGGVEREEENEETSSSAGLAVELAEVLKRVEREASEEPALESHLSAPVRCVVPLLKGDTLRTAQRALARAHCRLGQVSVPRGHHARLVVARQGKRAGARLADRAPVAVKLGAPAHRRG